jgi:hypothetical protein
LGLWKLPIRNQHDESNFATLKNENLTKVTLQRNNLVT